MLDLLGLDTIATTKASSAGAGDMTASLTPADGEIWVVVEANGYNDEGALNGRWTFYRAGVTLTLDPAISHAATDRVSCYAKSPLSANAYHGPQLPFVLNSNTRLDWTVFGLGAGKKAYIDAVILVLKGVPLQ